MTDAPPVTPDPDAVLGRLVRQLLTTLDAANVVAPRDERSALLTLIVKSAARMVGASAASLFLLDEANAELTFEVAIGPKADEAAQFRVPLGHGIAGTVAATGQPLAISAPEHDPRFAADIARGIGHVPRSILCVPLRHGDTVIGVLEALDKIGRETFTASDIEVLSWFAEIAALAVEQTQRQDSLRAALTEALLGTRASRAAGADQSATLVDRLLQSTRMSPDYQASMQIASMISSISQLGDAEQQLCHDWLKVIAQYVENRQRNALGSLSRMPWLR